MVGRDRIRKLKKLAKKYENSALAIFFGDPNLKYFLDRDISTALLLAISDNVTLYLSEMDKYLAEDLQRNNGLEVKIYDRLGKIFEEAKGEGIKEIGLNYSRVAMDIGSKLSKKFKIFDISKDLEEMRSIKDKEEIRRIKKACRIANNIIESLVIEDDEQSIAASLIYEARLSGYKEAFDPIVASGANSALPHAKPLNKKVESPLIIDFGVIYENYCSDLTRTFILEERGEIVDAFNAVSEAKKEACKVIGDGVRVIEVDKAVRDVLREYGYEKFFLHSTGHGIGIEVHEAPHISRNSKEVLKNGNVFTIEPGIYITRKFGIRIEDVYLLERNRVKILSRK